MPFFLLSSLYNRQGGLHFRIFIHTLFQKNLLRYTFNVYFFLHFNRNANKESTFE